MLDSSWHSVVLSLVPIVTVVRDDDARSSNTDGLLAGGSRRRR